MDKLEKKLGYAFRDRALLRTALTHSSYANEHKRGGIEHNERLEYLGDAVLGFVTAEYLYRLKPELPEGQMTRTRSELVCDHSLTEVAQSLSLSDYILLGRGEEHSGGRGRPSIMENAVEAVIAAIYLDGGIEPARAFIMKNIISRMPEGGVVSDYKTALQEYLQRGGAQDIAYRMTGESGPDHMKVFTAVVEVNGQILGEGTGRNKKEAEQMAARMALEAIKK